MTYVVLGANLGDEGKGLITDYLTYHSKAHNKLVVRFNGGGQAGHTVQVGPHRFVFSNYGSGTLAGAKTYYSKFFIVNPIKAIFENNALLSGDIALASRASPTLFIDPHCRITTPYDMMINQYVEMARGLSRHGSVGLGINETVTRSECAEYNLCIANANDAHIYLSRIRKEWIPFRLNQIGYKITDEQNILLQSEEIQYHFEQDLKTFLKNVDGIVTPQEYFERYDRANTEIIFEGAQGLMLDQKYGTFPYATRSNTGLTNVISLCKDFGITDLQPIYVTRPYMTRHGAGPLEDEIPNAPCPNFSDETNVPNRWQGMLRFGFLDVPSLRQRITQDLQRNTTSDIKITPHVAITCLDQYKGEKIEIVNENEYDSLTTSQLIDNIRLMGDVPMLLSNGPSRYTCEVIT